ncbi:N-methyl-L-tryptophan oxidase [Heyndrickxia acidicola]|uniref:N-methyl-L-tryptophan oxidase n=1 Tax=Heyndrickxia acidicola TaxID=209389 RepID=A0ABU6MB07_9BACI|nr:N-methyl-L-tryptophan oxidase [Heyndrickxia acidicola]MED1201844.1 N-methyl-L-tryptophan oxidase [Heyndrickxia acidicola]
MEKNMIYDAAIIGAGTMGMAAGAFLAGQNRKTLLLDAFDPPHHHGSHHGGTRMIRHAYGEGRQYVSLVKRAQELWEALEKKSGLKILEKTGVLGLGPRDSVFLKETRMAAEKYGLPLEILSSSEVMKRWPGMTMPKDYIGCFEKDSGLVYSENALKAWKEEALEKGASLVTHSPVQRIDPLVDGIIKIVAEAGVFFSKKVIVTAGAWAAKLMPELQLPIQPVRKVMGWFDASENEFGVSRFPSFYVEDRDKMFYGFPTLNGGGLKLGRTDGGQPIDPDQHVQNFGAYPEDEGELRDFLKTYMPEANGGLKEGKTCLMTQSVDHHFIIDYHPEHENIILACGFSGHGFKFGSVMGEVLAELAIHGRTEFDLSLFSIDRFRK